MRRPGLRCGSIACRVIPGGVNSGNRWGSGLEDLVVASASGARFTDADGRTVVDYHGAGGPALLGHCRRDVDEAAARATSTVDLVGAGRTELEVLLAERIVELVPCAERVLLTISGSEATYHAIRLARAATGRRLLIKFEGCYHGWHDAVALNLTSPAAMVGTPDPLSAGSVQEVLDLTLVLPFNDLEAVRATFADHGAEIAAVIVEPIAHNVGCILPEDGFLAGLRELCDVHGSVLIFDEVITGFRHGLGGFQEISGVTPDLSTLGKALANGYPLGALVGRADLMDRFSTKPEGDVFFAGTYNAHPGAVAAALQTIAVLTDEPVHEQVFHFGDVARRGLRSMWDELGVQAVVSGFGSIYVSYFTPSPVRTYTDLLRNDEAMFCGYRRELLADGVFEFPRNLKRNHISYAHTESDIDELIDRTGRAAARFNARNTAGRHSP